MKGALRREALGQLQPVDAMDPREVFGNGPRLVGLQAADEMPGERQPAQGVDLRDGRSLLLYPKDRAAWM